MAFTKISSALSLENNMWHDFTGKIGNSEIQLSLYISANGDVNGNYCYKKFEKKIFLSGTINDKTFELTELIEDNPNGYLKGTITTATTAGDIKLEGTWTNFDKSKTSPLSLQQYASCGGTLEHRYQALMGTDEEAESFVKHLKKSILNKDKEWVAAHINYPITVNSDGKKLHIKTKEQLIVNFDSIFHKAYLDKMKTDCVCNLFENYQGAMLGNGELWINNTASSTAAKYAYCIIAINN